MAKTQRLDKVLAHMGFGTRKELKKFVRSGVVTINGDVVTDSAQHIDPEEDVLQVWDAPVQYRKFVYVMMNKPAGVISATYDNKETTVLDLLDEEYAHYSLFPVGRLDKDTVGLLLLTNDGKLAHELTSPRKNVPKTYYARVAGVVHERDVEAFAHGVTLDDGYTTKPAKLKIIHSSTISEIELTITEGKYHQVKRMFDAVGKKVILLKRISFATLALDSSLAEGSVRELLPEEIVLLKERGQFDAST